MASTCEEPLDLPQTTRLQVGFCLNHGGGQVLTASTGGRTIAAQQSTLQVLSLLAWHSMLLVLSLLAMWISQQVILPTRTVLTTSTAKTSRNWSAVTVTYIIQRARQGLYLSSCFGSTQWLGSCGIFTNISGTSSWHHLLLPGSDNAE